MSTARMRMVMTAAFSVAIFAVTIGAEASPITWTNWTSASSAAATGTAGAVNVGFTGAISPDAQTSCGTFFWTTPSTYTSSPEVDNAPPDCDIIRLTGGTGTGTQTLTFSSPVVDPVMAILSLGQTNVPVSYVFNAPFDVLNFGPGFFGNGPLTELPGNILVGNEGHGIIQFSGTFTSISWTIPNGEFWHGFQVGIPSAEAVPEPATLLLLGTGIAGMAVKSRRRRKQNQ